MPRKDSTPSSANQKQKQNQAGSSKAPLKLSDLPTIPRKPAGWDMDEHPPPAPAPTYDWVPESAAQHDAFMDISGGWYSEEPPALASYITQTSTGNDPIDSELQRRLQMVITALNANPLRTRADVRSAQNTALLITALVECRYGIDKIPQRRGVGVSCEEDGVDETGSSRIALVVSEQKLQSLLSITGTLSRLDFSSPEIPHDTWSMLLDCTHQRGNGSFEEASVYRGEVMDLAVGLQRRAWPKTAIETFVQISLDVFEIAEDGRRSVRRKLVEESKAALPPHIIFLGTFAMSPIHVFDRMEDDFTCYTAEVPQRLQRAAAGRPLRFSWIRIFFHTR
ncbi:unnamed protein product [Tilletia laevis]|uniref:Uncharacterized protein n=2 Tax=Tilletia TaxID=13289 RepID=A0A9N8M4E0_9BASI|nr:hypothetical protein CF335_g8820 [Tilletia laevis]KAE8189697.1 hypothetical protein CF336_g5619 [Tilletia laevis]CAD6952858.1 unnamed protein product [Tilletia laevis]CAD6953803.1 unnamed protein product [Tilletia caries]CAD6957351.1 unnamed protein product [Tilletia laevis]